MNVLTRKKALGVILVAALVAFAYYPSLQPVNAAALTALSDTISTLKKNTVANHDILFTTPTGLTSGQTVILTFQSDYSIPASLDYTDIDVLDDGANVTLAASPSGATWGAVRTSSTVITLTNGTTAVGAGSVMRIKIGTNASSGATGDQQITNPTTNGSKTLAFTGSFGDTGTTTAYIVDDDQVAVSASVDQSITFSISDNTVGFGTLSASAARYATGDTAGNSSETEAHNLIVGTNASSGYSVTATGTTLTSGSNTITAIGGTNTSSSVGSEQFGLRMTASGGNGAVNAPYSASGFAFDYANFPDTVATSTSASSNTTYSVRYLANIGAQTEAGTYTTAITYIATANY